MPLGRMSKNVVYAKMGKPKYASVKGKKSKKKQYGRNKGLGI